MSRASRRAAGFSLIELMVAMTVTLIITGAIYGLLASGQNAFRREPALTERQQNVRLAMDLIVRDVENAGAASGPFDRVFTDAGVNNPSANSWPAATVASQNADFLEMIVSDGTCPTLNVCQPPGANLFTNEPIPTCFPVPGLYYVYSASGPATKDNASQGPPGIIWLEAPGGGGGGGCGSGHLNSPAGQSWLNPSGNYSCNGATCTNVTSIQWIRYQIAACDPAIPAESRIPCLWRTELGSSNSTGTAQAAQPPAAPWQLIARGIEDMQVQYFRDGAWNDTPGTPTAGNYASIVRQVRVTLSSRAVAGNLGTATAGLINAQNPGTGSPLHNPPAVRGRITSSVSPRGALRNLLAIGASPRPTPQPWN